MTFSFSSLVRLLVLMAVGSTMLAVGLSRLAPARPAMRALEDVRYANINEFFLNNAMGRTPVWLDAESGLMADYPIDDGDVLESASCSPWVDEKNQRHAVGRWTTRTKDGPMSISKDFGIARYTFPGGQMLDQVSTEAVPVGAPCWYPGTRARVLYTGGDGNLYHFAFESEPWVDKSESKAGRDLKPMQLSWRCPKPGDGMVFFGDVNWPEDPRLGGCLLASLREQVTGPGGSVVYSRTSLWWLKLNFAGTEIVDLGRLLLADEATTYDLDHDHKCPTVGELPDGRLILAYLRQRKFNNGWEVRVAPIEIDNEHRAPRALERESVLLASRCQPAPPIFSADGEILNAIAGPEAKDCRVLRLHLAGVFPENK